MTEPPRAAAPPPAWPLPLRIAFRFFFALFTILCLPPLITMLPGGSHLEQNALGDLWNHAVSWSDAHLLHLDRPISADPDSGSSDRLFSWVELGCSFAAALVACAVWSLLDRKRTQYRKLNGWLMIGVRYYLLDCMIFYGFHKVIKNQFPDPDGDHLLQRAGDFSPMGLAWLFMGSSTAYTFFAGFGELLGGVLLFFRRTTTLGALVIAGVMTNVVALNFCYDIPVKIFSSTLLALALYLLAPDLSRLANVLLFNQPTAERDLHPPFRARGLLLGGHLLKAVMVYALFWGALKENLELHQQVMVKHPVDGLWKVTGYQGAGVEIAPSLENAARWTYLSVTNGNYASTRALDDSKRYLAVSETSPGEWIFRPQGQGVLKNDCLTFTFDPLAPAHARLTGAMQGTPLELRLERVREDSFLLVNRGFHWVNDVPFNR